jgi:hypothetical protein
MKRLICAVLTAFIVSLVPAAEASADVNVRGAELLQVKSPGAHKQAKRSLNKKQKRQLKKKAQKKAEKKAEKKQARKNARKLT